VATDSDLVVILHDACYGHRFARPKTSKASLLTIVERPERIQATVLGVSTAYVRLGGRHAEGVHPPSDPKRNGPVDPVPFRIRKSSRAVSLVSQAVTQVHGAKWMAELKMMCEGAEAKLAFNGKELIRPTSSSGDVSEKPKLHEGDLYLCSESMNALEGALGGVCDAVDAVFDTSSTKRAFVCVRPPGHHCSADYPSGFCWLNNVHVGISHASITHGLTHAAIIDFDLHHGDGSQAITWEHNSKSSSSRKNGFASKKAAIGYFSLHDINSYPCESGDEEKVQNASLCLENAHGQTIWNVHLQPWKNDHEFWQLYDSRYSILLSKTRDFLRNHTERLRSSPNSQSPKAAIFISAGFDASEWESPGMQRHKVNVPTDFYARFTRDINNVAEEGGLGVDGRVISVLEGGYSDRALMSGVFSHLCGLSLRTGGNTTLDNSTGLGQEMSQRLGRLSIEDKLDDKSTSPSATVVDSRWWALPKLEELEALVYPPPSTAPPKKSRVSTAPTYTIPTQASTAKIVSPSTNRRVSSNSFRQRSVSGTTSRAPSPPPPEVGWTVATHELCKLLIPSDRQTQSCNADELNAEATRARRTAQSNIALHVDAPSNDIKGMQLRDRRAKAPISKKENEIARPASRANRRKTIAGDALKLEHTVEQNGLPLGVLDKTNGPVRRRLSVASSTLSTTDDTKRDYGSETIQLTERMSSLDFSNNRPSSSLNGARGAVTSGAPPPQPVKKPRAPAKPKAPTQTVPIRKQSLQVSVPPVSSLPKNESAAASPTTQGVDQLASGIKKMSIKLNVPPRDHQTEETKEKKSKSAPKAAKKAVAAKPTKKFPADPLPEKTQPVQEQGQTNPGVSRSLHQSISIPMASKPPIRGATAAGNSLKLSAQSSSEAPIVPSVHNRNHSQPPVFMPPTSTPLPVLATGPEATFLTEPIRDAPVPTNPLVYQMSAAPSNAAPVLGPATTAASIPSTPKKTKQELPIFTADTPIIFGHPGERESSLDASVTHDSSHNMDPALSRTVDSPKPIPNSTSNVLPDLSVENAKGNNEDAANGQPEDIWGVPDTPQQRMA
jgi:histone deacetylase HOS3